MKARQRIILAETHAKTLPPMGQAHFSEDPSADLAQHDPCAPELTRSPLFPVNRGMAGSGHSPASMPVVAVPVG